MFVRLRGNGSLSSFSFSYGAIPSDSAGRGLGLWGAGSGLRVSLVLNRTVTVLAPSVDAQLLYVRYDGLLVHDPVRLEAALHGDVARLLDTV